MVTSVPWQLKSSERVVERDELTPGATDGATRPPCATTGPPRRRRPRRTARPPGPGGRSRPPRPRRGGPVPAHRSRDRPAAHPDGGRPVTAAVPADPGLDGPGARPGRRRGRPRRALRRAGPGRRRARAWSSSGTRCRGSGCARSSPKTVAVRSAAPTRSPCSIPRRAGSSRRARGPAPVAAAAATGSTPTGRPSAR